MKDHPAVLKYAHSFSRTTDVELDDLLQEARIAHLMAERAVETGQYDAKKSSFNTYATRLVYRAMCDEYARSRKRVATVSIDGGADEDDEPVELADAAPSPERRLMVAEMIRELPDDARAVVDVVLGDLWRGSTAGRLRRLAPIPEDTARRVRRYVRQTLGMSRARTAAAFAAISAALADLDRDPDDDAEPVRS